MGSGAGLGSSGGLGGSLVSAGGGSGGALGSSGGLGSGLVSAGGGGLSAAPGLANSGGQSEVSASDRRRVSMCVPEEAEQTEELPFSKQQELWELRKQRKQAEKKLRSPRPNGIFLTSPGAISTDDRDASKRQGKFDMGRLYQARLRTDRHCMIVDFSDGRVLLSNELCDELFSHMTPLPEREVTDLLHEEDRMKFSSAMLYLNIGHFTVMEPQVLRVMTSGGVQPAVLSGELLVGTWWWLDFAPGQEAKTGQEAAGIQGATAVTEDTTSA